MVILVSTFFPYCELGSHGQGEAEVTRRVRGQGVRSLAPATVVTAWNAQEM